MLNETKLHKISARIILEKNNNIDKHIFFEVCLIPYMRKLR